MTFCEAAVFVWFATLTHFIADFITHRRKKGRFILLHCFLYALLFLPLFWWMEVSFLWLILIFASHLAIDSQQGFLLTTCEKILQEKDKIDIPFDFIVAGLDHVLHLSVIGMIAIVSVIK